MQTKEVFLQKYFGYSEFRNGQAELIEQLLVGGSVIAVMPTEAGKSLCYQLPALMLEGLTLVVSPLISLMKDQVRGLKERGIEAAYLSSGMSKQEYGAAVYAARNNKCKLLYVSPERLQNEQFKAFVSELKIALVVVDEAHCIVRWGESFRPAYLSIRPFLDSLPGQPLVAAFTATATPAVRREIIRTLALEKPLELVAGFDRSNLTFRVEKPMVKRRFLRGWLPEQNGCGIIYCATQRQTEDVYNDLNAWGYPAGRYHAGLTMEERQRNQNAFI
ncbi:MAG: RecQ family ATP-dependent DNA helicase [Acidaminococcaceae bacterium]|nr:RecQ family ATP-dependent DNA helicase [Acidaminococcaceae bacterium]